MKNRLKKQLQAIGYVEKRTNRSDVSFFLHRLQDTCYVLMLISNPNELLINEQECERLRLYARGLGGGVRTEVLTVLYTSDLERARVLAQQDGSCWIVEPFSGELILFENQRSDMDGVRTLIENAAIAQKPSLREHFCGEGNVPWVTLLFVICNVVVFLCSLVIGDALLDKGCTGAWFLRRGEYYRLISAMFLHVDAEHLVGNMLLLYLAGKLVEDSLGHFPFFILYFVCGIAGNLLSAQYELFHGYYYSVGASGAVFGIMGMLVALVILNRGRLNGITIKKLLFVIVLSVYNGATAEEVNNIAHVGGLFTGFIVAFLFGAVKMRRENR